jgi:long-chain-fatty-acid--CoA ligase ACSBG
MISHDCITYNVRNIGVDTAKLKFCQERFISYLPLSHIAAQVLDVYTPLHIGITVFFAQPDALKGSLGQTLQEARPTFFFGVPRVWEKMQEKIEPVINNLTGLKSSLFKWATDVTREYVHSTFRNETKPSFSYFLAKTLVLNKVHKQLGLDQCSRVFSGAAPITKETLDFFINLGIPLCEVYGMVWLAFYFLQFYFTLVYNLKNA